MSSGRYRGTPGARVLPGRPLPCPPARGVPRIDVQAGVGRHYLRCRQIEVPQGLFEALQRHIGKEALGWVVEGSVAHGDALERAYPETEAPASIVYLLPQ